MLRFSSQNLIFALVTGFSLIALGAFICPGCKAEPLISKSAQNDSHSSDLAATNSGKADFGGVWAVSLNKGLSVALETSQKTSAGNYQLSPVLSWSSESLQQNNQDNYRSEHPRHDRYKNTIPVIYRVTLKGFSIMEFSDKHSEAWSLDKVKEEDLRKPEIMISFTKSF